MDRTLDTILDESRAFKPGLFPEGRARVRTVYFGGGTPSVIPAARLDAFLSAFREIWDIEQTEEWAFEANPETLTKDLLEVLGTHGVNRLSLGVQTFDDAVLQLLGRRSGVADAARAIGLIRDAQSKALWRGALNMDLIVGIPGQNEASVTRDVERCIEGGADHVSIYTLTVEEHTPMAQLFDEGLYKEMSAEETEALWIAADRALTAAGLENYEVSNYARPGFESRHNSAYWELKPYLGLGPGAVGTIPVTVEGAARVARMTNPNAFNYSRNGRSVWEHAVELLTPKDFLTDHFLVGLRTRGGLDIGRLESMFHIPKGALADRLSVLRTSWAQRGYAPQPARHRPGADKPAGTAETLALNREGRAILNVLLQEVLECLDELDLPETTPDWPSRD